MVTVTTDKDNYGKNEDVIATITVEKRIPGEDQIHVGVYNANGEQVSPWHYINFETPTSNVASWYIWMQTFSFTATLYDIQALYGQEVPGNKKIHHADHNLA
jgi:hypothetical protein